MQAPAFDKELQQRFTTLRCCVLVPTYNNSGTLEQVITGILKYTDRIIVINDGATDTTASILSRFPQLQIVTHPFNQGKGMALRHGFEVALKAGNRYAISIDSDGQHFPADLKLFLDEIESSPDTLIIGARNMSTEQIPGKSSFGNKFSNFWFLVETRISLPDTQSGYRLYPVEKMKDMRFFTSKFEFEIEVMVKAAWKDIPIKAIPIQVYYASGKERVSHFRPGKDFLRISLLNTWLCILAILWYKPKTLLMHLRPSYIRAFFVNYFMNPNESPSRKSMAVGIGILFGILPIWGFQLAAAIFFALIFKLNKVIVGVAANISVPPMIPFILYGSVKTGELITGREVKLEYHNITIQGLKDNAYNFYVYFIGAAVLAVVAALFFGFLTLLLLQVQGRKRTADAHP
jgi:glycosyltransferase involved in cell wall biosynthesis